MALLTAAMFAAGAIPAAMAFELPPFTWDVIPRFVHCGPDYKPDQPGHPARLPLSEVYKRMSTYPLATLEKFTLETKDPANVHEESKILEAAKAIKSYNTSTKVIFYHMAWQNFAQYDLYNQTRAHAKDYWTVTWDNGTIPGVNDWQCLHGNRHCSLGAYNLSNQAMRAAWCVVSLMFVSYLAVSPDLLCLLTWRSLCAYLPCKA